MADRVKNQLGSLEPEVVGAGASSAVASRASSGQVRTHRCPTQQSSCIPNKGVTVSSLSIPNCPGQVCMTASFPLPLSLHSPPFFPHFLSKLSELTPRSPSRLEGLVPSPGAAATDTPPHPPPSGFAFIEESLAQSRSPFWKQHAATVLTVSGVLAPAVQLETQEGLHSF